MSERSPRWGARSNPVPARARSRALTLAVAIMAAVLAVVLWFSAATMVPAGSPVDPDAHITDRVWDPRRLAAAVICFDVALVAFALAFVHRRSGLTADEAASEVAGGAAEASVGESAEGAGAETGTETGSERGTDAASGVDSEAGPDSPVGNADRT
ncbi:hypothetical protein [Dietzia sp.]|uniref:hypothetical protein n=1 Tax=Dietzia sp. TaxID=1871616 RepID=UPI002FDB5576